MTFIRIPAVLREVLVTACVALASSVAIGQSGIDGFGGRAETLPDSVLMPSDQPANAPTFVTSEPNSQSRAVEPGHAWDTALVPSTAHCLTDSCEITPSHDGCRGRCGACQTTAGVCDPPGLLQFLAAQKHANWALRADALLLWRNAPPSRPFYYTVVPGTGQVGSTALNANDLNSDMLVAPRLSLLRNDCDGRTLEATYLYAGNFYSERSLPYVSGGYATSPPTISINSANAQLLGQLQSLEFNTRHCVWADTCQFLIGARWLQWNESLERSDSYSVPPNPGPDPVIGNDFYNTQCFNNLWGGQIGLDTLLLGRPGMARVEGLVKAGAYYNNAGQNSTFTYVLNGQTFPDQNAGAAGPAACSFVGEVGLTAVLPICCNWDFRCGYFGLWLTNLAQPTRQYSGQNRDQFASVGTLDTAGSAILQGLSLGLEGRW
jgi:hypothetical protein